MKPFNSNYFFLSFHLLLFTLFTLNVMTGKTDSSQDVCATKDCGEGTCKATSSSLLGFECECFNGWKKVEIGPLILPSCVIPNCSVDFGCGLETPSPPPPPPPPPPSPVSLLPPLPNFSDPCTFTWCGDGSCVANETRHICQCFEGSSNLMNNTDLPCFKECYLGADCNDVELLPPPPPAQPSTAPASKRNGSPEVGTCLRIICTVIMAFLASIFLTST